MSRLLRILLVVGGAPVLAAACSSASLKTPPPATTTPEQPGETPDAGDETDASAEDVVVEARAPGKCPPPAILTPASVPPGYLKAVKVTISNLADGDSGDFNFPTAPNQGVRMLYINTEESSGAEMTAFGVKAKGVVIGWFNAATDIQIAVRESFKGSNTPDIDPYGRWLSLIFLDGQLLQTRIVRDGLSAYYTAFGCAPQPVHDALLHAEAEANEADRGIWGPGPPAHNDYEVAFAQWVKTCRPNPFKAPYCP